MPQSLRLSVALCIGQVLIACLAQAMEASSPPPDRETPRAVIFDDQPEGGWTLQAALAQDTVHSGTSAISVTLGDEAARARDHSVQTGIAFRYLWAPEHAFTTRPFARLELWVNGGDGGGQRFSILTRLAGDDWQGHQRLTVTDVLDRYNESGLKALPAHKWIRLSIPLADLGVADRDDFNGFSIDQAGGGRQQTLYLDDVALVGVAPTAAAIAIDVNAVVRHVDARLFGICTYGTASVDDARDVAASIDAGYHLHRAFYPTFNERPGMVPNPGRGLLFAEKTGAEAMGSVDYSDMEADHAVSPDGKRTFGTPEQAASLVAYANAAVDGPTAALALGTDVYGRDWGTVNDWARLRSGAGDGLIGGRDYKTMRINHPSPFRVVMWELDNEPWMHAKDTDWRAYADFCKRANGLMKRVDPTIQTGVTPVGVGGTPSHPDALNPRTHQPGDTAYFYLAGLDQKTSPGRYVPDFIIWHWYGATETGPSADLATLLHYECDPFRWTTVARRLRSELVDFFGADDGAKPRFVVTENNMRSTFPLNRQMHALTSALYLADDLGGILQTHDDEFIGLTWHDWDDGDLHKGGCVPNPAMEGWRDENGYNVYGWHGAEGARTRYPTHYAFKMLSRIVAAQGDLVVAASSSTPMVAAYAVHRADGGVAVLLINKLRSTSVPATIAVRGWKAGSPATLYRYGPAEERAEGDISLVPAVYSPDNPIELPAYSLTVVALTAADAAESPTSPAAPTMVVATPGNGKVTLCWTAMSGAQHYDIWRAEGEAAPAPWQRGITHSAVVDEHATNGLAVRYAILSVGAKGTSVPSAAATTVPVAPPGPVQGLTATSADRQVELAWQPVEGATDYIVRRSTGAGPFDVLTTHPYRRKLDQTLTFTEFNDRGLTAGRMYRYQVSACTGGGEGPAAEVQAAPAEAQLGPWSAIDLAGREDGSMRMEGQELVVTGSGNAWYGAGEGRFLYQTLQGDGAITAQVASIGGHGQYGKNLCGVMIRDATRVGKDVHWALLGITPADSTYGAALITSENGGGAFEAEQGIVAAERHDAPSWVRLVRKGDTLTAALSRDGITWKEWQTVTLSGLPPRVFLGPLVNSMAYFATASGRFTHVHIDGRVDARP